MSDASAPHADLYTALLEATDAGDVERMDELLDLMRLQADYEQTIAEIVETMSVKDYRRADAMLDRLRGLPTLEAFSTLRSTTN